MPEPTRRQLLTHALTASAVGAGLALSGCGIDWGSVRVDTGRSEEPPTFTPDDLARFAAIEKLTTLAEQARQLGAQLPAALEVEAAHREQLTALGELPGPVPSASVTPKNWPSTPPSGAPVDAAGLIAAERALTTELLDGLNDLSGAATRLLAAVAAGTDGCARHLARAADLAAPEPVSLPAWPDALQPVSTTAPENTADADEEETAPAPSPAEALKASVAADDAAGYAYGPIAAALPVTGEAGRATAARLMDVHTRRSQTVRALAKTGGVNLPAPPAAYRVVTPPDESAARQACAALETTCAAAAAALLGSGDPALRPIGLSVLFEAAAAEHLWSGRLIALPGLA